MICPNCQTDNRDTAKFCDNCGTPLQVNCPNCDTVNRPGAKFCDNCGHSLNLSAKPAGRQPTTRPQPAVIDQLIPRDFAAKLEAARHSGTMEGERRVVTMLFCDVVGSTAASEQLDPEEWTEIMNSAFDYMIRPIYRYEGTVARLMGDAILAFFGAPIAHEDDPQRAVLAGLDIVQSVQQYRQDVERDWDIELNVRVGINTGLVVVGAVGSDLRLEYTAMGEAINLAARMEQTAEPGTVQIAEDTYRLVAPLFEFEALGGIEVKGKAEPVQSYRVLGRPKTPGRRRGIEGLDSPLIGREQEFEMLRAAAAGLGKGIGGIACLIGEAGLGKSRLIREVRQHILAEAPGYEESEPAFWHQTESLSYETEQPYALFQRLIRREIGAAADDSPEALREKLNKLAGDLPADEREGLAHVFESLYGLDSTPGRAPLVGEAFKARLYEAMTTLWRQRASIRPLVLICDDLHWSDPASIALLLHLFPLAERAPLLFVCAMRPDKQAPSWRMKQEAKKEFSQRYSEVNLHPLSANDSDLLVSNLLANISDLPPQLRERILEKTEGNPFFVEEVVRSLIESGAVVQDESGGRWQATGKEEAIEIPGNVQAVLMARIDRLEEEARHTLQLASVVGRSFYYRVLARIVEVVERLEGQLLTLQRAELIREAARLPELEYVFRHALSQEAAYNTILLKQRRVFHLQVADSLEALFPGRREELAGALARHFYQGRAYDKALAYYIVAGDEAFRLHAPAEASGHYARALEIFNGNQATAGAETLVYLYTRLGRAYELDNQHDLALANYQEMDDLAARRGDRSLKLASLTAQCIVRATQTPLYDPPQARKLGQEALKLSREIKDQETEARVLWGLLLVEAFGGGDNQKALAYGRRSLSIARELDLREQMAFTLTNLTFVYWNQDQMEEARKANLESRAMWQELGNTPMLADSYTMTHLSQWFAGEIRAVVKTAADALRISQSIGNNWNIASSLMILALIYFDLGEIGAAMKHAQEAKAQGLKAGVANLIYTGDRTTALIYLMLGKLEAAGQLADELFKITDEVAAVFRANYLATIIQIRVAQGDLDEAKQVLEQTYDQFPIEGLTIFQMGVLIPAEAELRLAQGQHEVALAQLQKLIDRERRAGARYYLADALWLKGRALIDLNRLEEARESLREAHVIAQESEARRILWQILATWIDVEDRLGNETEALALRGQTQEVIHYIAEHIEDEELRTSFLSRPEVQSLLAK